MTATSVTTDPTADAAADVPTDGDERLAYRGLGLRLATRPEIVGVVAAITIYMFFWAVSAPFARAGGAASVLDVAATLGIMAVAVGVLMIGGEFDLSSGAMTGTMGIIVILLVKEMGERGGAGLNYTIALPLSLLIALAFGWVNGKLVEKTALPSFIVTLAAFFVLRGLKVGGSKIIVDQIQVGRADEGAHYEFWRKIFGSEWERQDHVWGARDGVFTVLLLLGGVLLALAVYEYAFRRRATANPLGMGIAAAGAVAVAVGVVLFHSLDGSDWLAMAVVGAGALALAFGWCTWRYEPLASAGPIGLDSITRPVGIGVGLLVLAVLAALAFDPYDGTDIVTFVTEQGLRAILFTALAALGGVALSIAVYRARSVSVATKAAALAILSVATFALALFIQSESQGARFRTELFGVFCLAALFGIVWAAMSMRFEVRRFDDPGAERFGRLLGVAGGGLVLVGVIVKMLFAVQEEIDEGNPARLALFKVSTLWFIGFVVVMAYVLRRTAFGNWVYAVGGNKDAARQVGVPAARTKTQLFMLVAGAAWLVGVLLAFKINALQAATGNGEEFEYIIAAVVGGTLLTGGYGTAVGAAIGGVIMAISQQGISFAGFNTDWRFLFLGLILLVAVFANSYVRRIAERLR